MQFDIDKLVQQNINSRPSEFNNNVQGSSSLPSGKSNLNYNNIVGGAAGSSADVGELGKPNSIPKEDYSKILKNYVEVPKNEWVNLQPGDYIRYIDKNGELKRNGVKVVSVNDANGIYSLTVKLSKPPYHSWAILLSSTQKIYEFSKTKKEANNPTTTDKPGTTTNKTVVVHDDAELKNLKQKYAQMETRVSGLKNELDAKSIQIQKLENVVLQIVNRLKKSK